MSDEKTLDQHISDSTKAISGQMKQLNRIGIALTTLGIPSGNVLLSIADKIEEELDNIDKTNRAIIHENYKMAQQGTANILGVALALSKDNDNE